MKGLIAIFLTLAFLKSAHAGQAFAGLGSLKCSWYAHMQTVDRGRANLSYQSWLQGFFSGMNTFLGASGKPLLDLTSVRDVEHSKFMAVFCEKHPDADYKDGALEMIQTLPRMAAPKL
jgi:hypothetical protein